MTRAYAVAVLVCCAGLRTAHASSGDAGKTVIVNHGGVAQTEIVTTSGIRIYVDVADPTMVSKKPTDRDILLVSRGHFDHWDGPFIESFPGKKLILAPEVIADKANGLRITGILSARVNGDKDAPERSKNIIYLIEDGKLRIACLGDFGQHEFTAAQRVLLNDVDVLITPISYPHGSSLILENQTALVLAKSMNAKLIIPTHSDEEDAVAVAARWWKPVRVDSDSVSVSKDSLPKTPSLLLMGLFSKLYAGQVKAESVTW